MLNLFSCDDDDNSVTDLLIFPANSADCPAPRRVHSSSTCNQSSDTASPVSASPRHGAGRITDRSTAYTKYHNYTPGYYGIMNRTHK